MKFQLQSGRSFTANHGILGVTESEPCALFHGHDGEIDEVDLGGEPLTAAERGEIAAYMVDLWRKWGGLAAK